MVDMDAIPSDLRNLMEILFYPEGVLDTIFFSIILITFAFSLGRKVSANVLITIGIFGTFLGISLGLASFDVTNINQSIPKLLDGLKLSFKTSIWGMFFGLIIKLIEGWSRVESESSNTPALIKRILLNSHEKISDLRDKSKDFFQKSLDLNKSQHTEYMNEFRNFSKTMAEQNSKALIEALNEIIRDFNKNLTEQFGENFKQLNIAVHKLVDWQENYKTHLETLQSKIDLANESIQRTEKSLEKIVTHTQKIPEYLSQLDEVLNILKLSTEEYKSYLEGIKELRNQAIQTFPIIEKNIKQITDDFSQIVQDSIERTQENLNSQNKAFKSLEKGFGDLEVSAEGLNIQVQTTLKGILQKMSEEMDRKFGEWDQLMQEELQRVLELLGKHLASINEKIAQDYKPIIQHVQSILNEVKKLR